MTEPDTAVTKLHEQIAAMRSEVSKAFVGQQTVVDSVLIALLAGGHVLLEGVPGLGKTLLVKAMAKAFDGRFSRIQFTPDLMPSDVSGHAVFDAKADTFRIRKGPVFTNLLLADEINRAPAKTQAALLEVMQESHVTI
ncbi:MAG: AAA family ATPase, partial [Woeseiaceae bacterium]